MSARSLALRALTFLVTALPWIQAHAASHSIIVTHASGEAAYPAAVSVYVDGASTRASRSAQAQMVQRNKSFVPTVLVVQTGTPVSFPNFDTVRHHVYSFSSTKSFELKLYAGTPATPVIFDRPGTATLGCNIHDRMLGYIHVVDTPYFGQTDAQGRIDIELPPGRHVLRVWTPEMGEKRPGQNFSIDTSEALTRVTIKP